MATEYIVRITCDYKDCPNDGENKYRIWGQMINGRNSKPVVVDLCPEHFESLNEVIKHFRQVGAPYKTD